MKVGEKIEFSYTGNPQEFIVPVNGIYKLECWGAQGGDTYWNKVLTGGKGGYASGHIHLTKGVNLHIYVGGRGGRCTTMAQDGGGFNGGGNAFYHNSGNTSSAFVGGGGGATDIRINLSSLNHRVIVAGGGGGSGYDYDGTTSYGGGANGSNGSGSSDRGSCGGTQTQGGATTKSTHATSGTFGAGGYGTNTWVAGGGGGWYGGSACYCGNAGGGSGYVLTETSHKPNEYALTSDYWMTNTELLAGNISIPKYDGIGTQKGNSGNGFARITLIESFNTVDIKCSINGQVKEAESVSVKVNNNWNEVESIFVKIGNEWKTNV